MRRLLFEGRVFLKLMVCFPKVVLEGDLTLREATQMMLARVLPEADPRVVCWGSKDVESMKQGRFIKATESE